MKNLKNLTIASTLCISTCITAPSLTNAMMKSGKPSPLSTTFMTKQDYINFTSTGKKSPGPLVGSRLLMFGDNNTSTSTPSRQPLPSTTLKKQVKFWDSSSSTSSKTSKNTVTQSKLHSNFQTKKDYIDFTGTGKKTLGSRIQSRINMLSDKNRSNKTTSKPILTKTSVKERVSFFESLSSKSSNLSSKKSISTQTSNTSDVSTQTTNTLNKSTQTPNTSDVSTQTTPTLNKSTQTKNTSDASTQTKNTLNKSTQTEPQVSKSKFNKLKKFFKN